MTKNSELESNNKTKSAALDRIANRTSCQ